MTRDIHAGLFIAIVIVWPFIFGPVIGAAMTLLVMAINIALFSLVLVRCGSPALSFFEGLCIIAGYHMTGCANISILIIIPILSIVYTMAIFHTLMGLNKGKEYSQNEWIKIVESFSKFK